MTDLTPYMTCSCSTKTAHDGQPFKADLHECGTCGFQWCMTCHPCPSARSWCEGSDYHQAAQDRLDEVDDARAALKEASKRYDIIKEVCSGIIKASDKDFIMDEAQGVLDRARKRLHDARAAC